jgi:hypothetical protein
VGRSGSVGDSSVSEWGGLHGADTGAEGNRDKKGSDGVGRHFERRRRQGTSAAEVSDMAALARRQRTHDFFSILAFLINIREMNSAKTFFQDMSLFSRASPSGVIYEGVAPCALA